MRGVFDHLTMVRVYNRCIVLLGDGGDITRCAIRRIAALALQTLVSILTFKVFNLTLDGQYLGEIIQLVDTHFDCGQEKKMTITCYTTLNDPFMMEACAVHSQGIWELAAPVVTVTVEVPVIALLSLMRNGCEVALFCRLNT